MTQEAKKAALAQYLVTKGILTPGEVDAEISKMADQLSPVTAEQKGLTTDIDKAYEVMLVEKGANTPAPTEETGVQTQPTVAISSAEQMAITKTLISQKRDRAAVSANTTVEKFIFDRPAPSEQIPAGTKGVIKKETWDKIEQAWAGKLVDDDECKSSENFATLKAAAEAGTPVDIYIGGLNKKAIGYIMNIGTAVGSGNQSKQMTREDAKNFLVLDGDGYVLAGDTTPGLKLRYIKQKNDPRKPGQIIEARTVLAEANKQAAVEAGNYVVSREVNHSVTKEVVCKSALCFKVDTGKPKANGQGNIIRTIRVSVSATLPTLVRGDEFVDVFGTGEKVSNANLQSVPEGKAAQNISTAQQHAIATLRKKLASPDTFTEVADLADQLKAFEPAAGNAAPSMVM